MTDDSLPKVTSPQFDSKDSLGGMAIDGSWVKKDTQEYNRAEYDLEMALAPLGLAPKNLSIWKIDNPVKEAAHHKMLKKKLHLTTWSDFTTKPSEELFSVCQDGFSTNGDEGVITTNGIIPFVGHENLGDRCTILMFDTIVGLSKVVDETKKFNASHLPPGYDSLSLQKVYGSEGYDNNDDLYSDTSSNFDIDAQAAHSKEFIHRYQIFNANALFAKYVMRFTLTKEGDIDKESDVGVYDRRDFFDLQDWRPVTLREKMLQSSLAPSNRRDANLVTVSDAYKQTVAVSKMQDPKVANAQRVIRNTLTSIDDKVRQVNMSFASGEEAIIQAAKDAMEQLRNERDRKVNVLIATEGELRRKLQEIDFFEEHLVKMSEAAPEVDYLRMWRSHTELRGDVFGDPNNPKGVIDKELKLISNVQTDMIVEGRLEVTSSDSHEMMKLGFKPKPTSDARPEGSSSSEGIMGSPEGASGVVQDLNMINPTSARSNANNSSFTASVMTPGLLSKEGAHKMKTPMAERLAREAEEAAENEPPVPHSTIKPTPPPIHDAPVKPKRFVSVDDNLKVASKVSRFKLSVMSSRKQRLVAKDIEVQQMFGQSRILTSVDDARSLFFSLPGKSVSISTHLLFQAGEVAPTEELTDPTIDDFYNILLNTKSPTVFIIKSGDYIFGAYACTSWREGEGEEEGFFGSPKSFLFSITCDIKVPFMGRTLDVQKFEEAKMEGKMLAHEAMMLGGDFISFGRNDLVIGGDLQRCRSKIEESYGMGLEEEQAKTFIAGTNVFSIDAIEIFEIIQ